MRYYYFLTPSQTEAETTAQRALLETTGGGSSSCGWYASSGAWEVLWRSLWHEAGDCLAKYTSRAINKRALKIFLNSDDAEQFMPCYMYTTGN